MGNKILNLDLAVRDNNGNLINPEETSTIQLYFNHKNAVDRMSKSKVINCNITIHYRIKNDFIQLISWIYILLLYFSIK